MTESRPTAVYGALAANLVDRAEGGTRRRGRRAGRLPDRRPRLYRGRSSSLTTLDDGDIGVLFEEDGYAEIAFVRLPLAWLTGEEAE